MTDLVLRDDRDGLCALTLNRPEKLNALNPEMFKELRAYVDALAGQTDSIGCVVLKGAGRCFSAGNDLKDIAAGQKPPYPNFQSETIEGLANLPQPVITAVHGHCYTGALELALAGDLIIVSDSARIADTHGKWALTPMWGMSQRLPRRVGVAKAKEMMLTSKTITGKEAETMGLANMCVPDDRFDQEVEALARSILANSWHSNQANKFLVDSTDGMNLGEGLSFEVENTRGVGPDAEERIRAFTSKKQAHG
ncbi:MAG: enoyl-CoA hydratase/isomerase family protein [Deltaproteobacteria bacterium]|nr:enoyl-CoA hydratase/isomerase family protein [Deltaproteobacteria bacterium]